ncbi:hypothetical protein B5K06_33820 [Rhizobium grahamii]|uniref:Uncharacterized protein n=1 Tax=Rhizobium grahamii TaxID=1120045 RepID=A0A370KE00_9HYPH|nr:hypothetical protein B5K06_33820 [Rhizobium grahamii]
MDVRDSAAVEDAICAKPSLEGKPRAIPLSSLSMVARRTDRHPGKFAQAMACHQRYESIPADRFISLVGRDSANRRF